MEKFNINKQYSIKADEIRKKMVEMSFYKYGDAAINFGEGLVNAMKCAEKCLEAYNDDGNTEHLLDAMNYLMFEFMFPKHPKARYTPTGSNESVGVVGHPVLMDKTEELFDQLRRVNQ